MKNLTQSYNPIPIKNSPIEFVLIGMDQGDFRPIVISDNCGLDLLGFAASRSYSSKFEIDESVTSSLLSAWRKAEDSFIHQFVELNISAPIGDEAEEIRSSKVYFYWKGVRLPSHAIDEVRRIAEINFSIIINELYGAKVGGSSSDRRIEREMERGKLDGFLSWHVSPVVRIVNYFNVRKRRTRDLSRIVLTIYLFLVLAMAAAAASYFFERVITLP